MKIDQFYSDIDKNNFYLGMVSQVYKDGCAIQIENLSWLKQRRIKEELLIPNTVNYYVVVDSTEGLFIGEVYQSKIIGSQNSHEALKNNIYERVFPEMYIDIIGVLLSGENIFISPGFKTVGLTDKVYIVNNLVKEKFLESVEIKRLDKNYLTDKLGSFAKVVNIGDERISFYPETLFDRHLMAIGTTNSGKSTTALSILDKLVLGGKKILFIDPTGEYSKSFKKNEVESLTLGKNTVLETGKVSFTQWATLFETNDGTQPAVLADAIKSLKYQKSIGESEPFIKEEKFISDVNQKLANFIDTDLNFDLSLLPSQIAEECVEVHGNKYIKSNFSYNINNWLIQKVKYKLKNTKLSDFFGESEGKSNLLNELDDFMEDKTKSLYINTSQLGVSDGVGSMIIDLISDYMINKKEKNNIVFVLFIDEVHRYSKGIENGDYQTGLTSIAREGRKKGIFLFLTTQNPNDVPAELLGQIGSLIIHRLTHRKELESIRNYLTDSNFRQVPKLNQGEGIFTSINLLRDLHLQVDKCARTHLNSTTKL